ncbi:MAG TPA: hypothetical protein VFL96_02885, partial [Acidobacteriaceae bacterium]|nr:hypothetical protein [Acidobacteriaceae bacterium]
VMAEKSQAQGKQGRAKAGKLARPLLSAESITETLQSGDKPTYSAYADRLVHLNIGAYVSKAVFGQVNSLNTELQSLTVINMPTKALLDTAFSILQALGDEGFQARVRTEHEALEKTAKSISIENSPPDL